MDIDRLRFMLQQTADRLNELAARLDVRGLALTQRERQLARAALLPVLQEILDGVVTNYLQGIPIDEKILQEIKTLEVF